MPKTNKTDTKSKKLASQSAVNAAVEEVAKVLRRSNCASVLRYVPELTWMLFLRILDEREQIEAEESEVLGIAFEPALEAPYRWRDWGAPPEEDDEGRVVQGEKRHELDQSAGAFMRFINKELLPHLQAFATSSSATPRQKVIGEILSSTEETRVDTEANLKDALDLVHEISAGGIDQQHVFPISQAYEGLLLTMGQANRDGGQFYTPRDTIRAMIRVVDPDLDATVYDPCCGTGGFLAEAYDYLKAKWEREGGEASALDRLKSEALFGREKDDLAYPLALANLVLHGVDVPRIWHGNTLTGDETYADLFLYESGEEPGPFDLILTNPPFGGKEGKAAQSRFAFKTSATQVLFLQHAIDSLKDGGRCGMVIDEGVLFRTNEKAFVQTKKKLLDECDLFCVVSLPGGVFSAAGAGVKTSLLFFEKGRPTERVWYYDLTDVKVTKTKPLTREHFEDFFELLPHRGTDAGDSERSWTVDLRARKEKATEKAKALRVKAQAPAAEAARLDEQLKAMRKAAKADPDIAEGIAEVEALQAERQAEAKRLLDRAQRVEEGVYDLKAVNPNAPEAGDTRTPEDLLEVIEVEGARVMNALRRLRAYTGIPEVGGDGAAVSSTGPVA